MIETEPFGLRKTFIDKNLKASRKRGSTAQYSRMIHWATRNHHLIEELGDFLGGRREFVVGTHNHIRDLVEGVIESQRAMIKIRSEIE